jgi:hypothetical protein
MRDDFPAPSTRSAFEPEANNGETTYRSVAALAADIGLSERSTRSALRRDEIPHIRIGRRFILPKAAIAEWLRTAGRSPLGDQAAPIASVSSGLVALGGRSEVTVMRPTKLAGR